MQKNRSKSVKIAKISKIRDGQIQYSGHCNRNYFKNIKNSAQNVINAKNHIENCSEIEENKIYCITIIFFNRHPFINVENRRETQKNAKTRSENLIKIRKTSKIATGQNLLHYFYECQKIAAEHEKTLKIAFQIAKNRSEQNLLKTKV